MALRLFLPDAWAGDPARRHAAGVPDAVPGRPKWQTALDEIGRLREQGMRFGCVLGDAESGKVAAFRHALDAQGLRWALDLRPTQKVFSTGVTTAWSQLERRSAGSDCVSEGTWQHRSPLLFSTPRRPFRREQSGHTIKARRRPRSTALPRRGAP